MRTPFECISPGCLKVSCLFVTNICILFSIITANTSSDFYNSYRRLQAKLLPPPEPSRAKFPPSGQVFRPSRPLAWTLVDRLLIGGRGKFSKLDNPSHAVPEICRVRHYPLWLLLVTFMVWRHTNNDTHEVVRVISRAKNNFYDVIRLKIIESRYFPKEKIKVHWFGEKKNKIADNWKRWICGEFQAQK